MSTVVFQKGISKLSLGTRKELAKLACNKEALTELSKDPHYEVRLYVAKNEATSSTDLKRMKVEDKVAEVRIAAAYQLQRRADQAGMPRELKLNM